MRRKKTIQCASCEQVKPPSKGDPEFCHECFTRIDNMRGGIVEHARAAACYVNSQPGYNHRKLSVAAFLGVFHPEMPQSRVREILRDME